MGLLRRVIASVLDRQTADRADASSLVNKQPDSSQRTYRYNRRCGHCHRGRRCGQRGFGQRQFAKGGSKGRPGSNEGSHSLDGSGPPEVVIGYPVHPNSHWGQSP